MIIRAEVHYEAHAGQQAADQRCAALQNEICRANARAARADSLQQLEVSTAQQTLAMHRQRQEHGDAEYA